MLMLKEQMGHCTVELTEAVPGVRESGCSQCSPPWLTYPRSLGIALGGREFVPKAPWPQSRALPLQGARHVGRAEPLATTVRRADGPSWRNGVGPGHVPEELNEEALRGAPDRERPPARPTPVVGANVGEGGRILENRVHPRVHSDFVVPYRLGHIQSTRQSAKR